MSRNVRVLRNTVIVTVLFLVFYADLTGEISII